jgi:hypothetical protein
MYMLGSIALCEGDYTEARANLEESLALCREGGDKLDVAMALPILGLIVAKQGKAKEAKPYYEEGLVISHSLRNSLSLTQSLTGLAGLWLQDRLKLEQQDSLNTINPQIRVARLSGAISALLASCEAVMFRPLALLYEQNLAVVRANLDEVTFETAFAQGQAMSMDEAVAYASANSESQEEVS